MGQSSVIIGRIGRPFGVKGWMHVHSFTEDPHKLFEYPHWQLQRGAKVQAEATPLPVEREAYKPHGGEGYVLKLKGWDDRDKAAAWTNADIVIDRDLLPDLPTGDYYWQDLIGLTVYNQEGHCLGVVDGFLETKANDVMVVKQATGKEMLIPYVPDAYNIAVDFEKNTLTVDWPEDF